MVTVGHYIIVLPLHVTWSKCWPKFTINMRLDSEFVLINKGNIYRKFSNICTRGFWDMRADETDTLRWSPYFASWERRQTNRWMKWVYSGRWSCVWWWWSSCSWSFASNRRRTCSVPTSSLLRSFVPASESEGPERPTQKHLPPCSVRNTQRYFTRNSVDGNKYIICPRP